MFFLFRIFNWAILGVVALYVAEGTGMVPRGQYFPTLPRLEASASDPGAWLGAVQWGALALSEATGLSRQAHAGGHATFGFEEARERVTRMGGYYGG